MKRICSFLLVLTMMFSLAACSNDHDPYRVTLAKADFVPTRATVVTKTVNIYETDDDGEKQIVGEQEVTETIGQSYRFEVDSAIVNGTEIDVSFSSMVAADMRAYDQIILSDESLKSLGAITEIQLFFKVYVSKDQD